MKDLQTRINMENGLIFVDEFDEGVWINFTSDNGSMHFVLNHDQAQAMIAAIQRVLEKA